LREAPAAAGSCCQGLLRQLAHGCMDAAAALTTDAGSD
jgi:hypothetical protein